MYTHKFNLNFVVIYKLKLCVFKLTSITYVSWMSSSTFTFVRSDTCTRVSTLWRTYGWKQIKCRNIKTFQHVNLKWQTQNVDNEKQTITGRKYAFSYIDKNDSIDNDLTTCTFETSCHLLLIVHRYTNIHLTYLPNYVTLLYLSTIKTQHLKKTNNWLFEFVFIIIMLN